MGCACFKNQEKLIRIPSEIQQKPSQSLKQILIRREKSEAAIENEYTMPSSNIVKDEEAKGVNLDNFKTEECLLELSCQPGNEKIIHALITEKFKLDTVVDIYGKSVVLTIQVPSEFKFDDMLTIDPKKNNQILTTKFWSPINFAVYFNQLLYVRYYLEQFQEPIQFAFVNPEPSTSLQRQWSQYKGGHLIAKRLQLFDDVFMIYICIQKKNYEVFDYLLNEKGQYWSYKKLKIVFDYCFEAKWYEGLFSIMAGITLQNIFRSFTVEGKIRIIESMFEELFKYFLETKETQYLKVVYNIVCKQPYLSVSFVNIIKGAYLQYYSDDRNQILKKILNELYQWDVIVIGKQLKIADNDGFIKELSVDQQYFDQKVFGELKSFIKHGLLENDQTYQYYYSDLIRACKQGTLEELESQVQKLESKTFNRCRNNQGIQIDLLTQDFYSQTVSTQHWGPLLYSLYHSNFKVFYQLIIKYRFNLCKELLLDPDDDRGEDSAGQHFEYLPFYICIHQKKLESLHLLLSQALSHLWRPLVHIKHICEVMKSEQWYDGLHLLVKSRTMRSFFCSLTSQEDKQEMIKAMSLQISSDSEKQFHDEMLRINLLLTQEQYSLQFMLYLIQNYDFLQDQNVQKDLFLFAKQCNESIRSMDLRRWFNEDKRDSVSLVIVKEFMILSLDENNVIQRNLKNELDYFFQMVRNLPDFGKLVEENLEDEAILKTPSTVTQHGSVRINYT